MVAAPPAKNARRLNFLPGRVAASGRVAVPGRVAAPATALGFFVAMVFIVELHAPPTTGGSISVST